NFLAELENNSFAKLVMANTDITRLPSDIFSTPTWILEADQSRQFPGLGADGRADPTGDNAFFDLVYRDDPSTEAAEVNYLKYTGEDHVVRGGPPGDDGL